MLSQARSLPFVPVWETECAFKWLDVAYQERDLGLPRLKTDFLLDSLRTDFRKVYGPTNRPTPIHLINVKWRRKSERHGNGQQFVA
jgi:hypothetical protein